VQRWALVEQVEYSIGKAGFRVKANLFEEYLGQAVFRYSLKEEADAVNQQRPVFGILLRQDLPDIKRVQQLIDVMRAHRLRRKCGDPNDCIDQL
jgi:hypothetical protein